MVNNSTHPQTIIVAPKTFIPVLFGHGRDDQFVQPHHSDLISESYAGDKNIIKFDGDHNSSRPQFFYDSVSIFFYNVLRPPHIRRARKLDKFYSLRDSKIGSAVNESLLYDILSSIQSGTTDAASSSSAPRSIANSTIASESVIRKEVKLGDARPSHDEPADVKDEQNCPAEDYLSYSSSTKSWGRCSSLALTDEESYPDFRGDDNDSEVFATPFGSMRETLEVPKEDAKNQKKKKKAEMVVEKIKSDRFEKLESFSRRLRLCILKGSAHTRQKSS